MFSTITRRHNAKQNTNLQMHRANKKHEKKMKKDEGRRNEGMKDERDMTDMFFGGQDGTE